ncbi:MAG: hypothetical protein KBB37_00285 [Bacteroidia bacterium]|nr:hypothetical protein [Bacteroidia bacterium]MBP7259696.1 hypothetical protein [Bacteroidia bacterium]MBP9179393.1 hypothetical protein [Bacteroidia bacterium]MBP9723353.1 hypothetical protein [Bacteroidia bacterium]
MNEKEELYIKLLSLFEVDDEILWQEFTKRREDKFPYISNSDAVHAFQDLNKDGYIYLLPSDRNIRSVKMPIKGAIYFENLIKNRQDEEIDRLDQKEGKGLMKRLNESTLQANLSIIETNESIRNLNKKTGSIYVFQIIVAVLTLVVAVVAIAVPVVLHSYDTRLHIERDSIENIRSLKKMQQDSVLMRLLLTNPSEKRDTANSKPLK